MVINPFVIKKWGALFLVGFISVLGYMIGIMQYKNHLMAIAISMACMLIGMLGANMLLINPFRSMVEGKGILVFDLNSTGIIRPFIVTVNPPYIRGRLGRKPVDAVFNRKTVMNLKTPISINKSADYIVEGEKKGGIKIELSEEQYNSGRFGMFHYPVLIWNSQIDSVVTKDFLSEQEKDIFAEHTVLYLNRKMEELTTSVREFARHVVDQMKPRGKMLGRWGWVVWVIVIALMILLVAMFAPAVWDIITGGGTEVVDSISGLGKGAVVPK